MKNILLAKKITRTKRNRKNCFCPSFNLACSICRPIYPSVNEGGFFCFVVIRSTELGCFRSCARCLWKALNEDGCMGLVPWCWDLWCKSSWILNNFFTEN
jgi:hypothetical protein